MTSPQEPPVDKDAMPSPLSWELTPEQQWLLGRFWELGDKARRRWWQRLWRRS